MAPLSPRSGFANRLPSFGAATVREWGKHSPLPDGRGSKRRTHLMSSGLPLMGNIAHANERLRHETEPRAHLAKISWEKGRFACPEVLRLRWEGSGAMQRDRGE